MFKNEKHRKQNEVAVAMAHTMAQTLNLTQTIFDDPGEKATLFMSAGMIGLSSLAACVTQKAFGGQYVPTQDHVLFACLMTANSTEFDREGGLKVEFDLVNIIKALDQFKDMTGRSFENQLNESLLERVNETRHDATSSLSANIGKFLPN